MMLMTLQIRKVRR